MAQEERTAPPVLHHVRVAVAGVEEEGSDKLVEG